ncbi:hypothetical protein [Methylomonas albis]|nr:hypothetical protein [Methylomonas albis]
MCYRVQAAECGLIYKHNKWANKLSLQNVGVIGVRNRTFRSQHPSGYAIANRSYAGANYMK